MRGWEPLKLGKARCIAETEKALRVVLYAEKMKQVWIPQAAIHLDSEVFEMLDEGELVVNDGHWWCKKEGYSDE